MVDLLLSIKTMDGYSSYFRYLVFVLIIVVTIQIPGDYCSRMIYLEKYAFYKRSIYDTILFSAITMNGSDRAERMLEKWGNYILRRSNHELVKFVSNNGCTKPFFPCIKPDEEYQKYIDRVKGTFRAKSRDIMIKRVYSVHYLVENTDADWVISLTDDALVNVYKLEEMINEFKQKGNPRTTPLVFGNCIDVTDYSFLQGGAGWIISRKAAEMIYSLRDWVIDEQWCPDDVRFGQVIRRIGLRLCDTATGRFLGHQFYFGINMVDLIKKNYSAVPQCEAINPQMTCGKQYHRLKDLVVYHTIWNDTELLLAGESLFEYTPSNIYWYQNFMFPGVCRK